MAIVRLQEPAPISDEIYPICVSSEYTLQGGDSAIAVGYGNSRDNGDEKIVDEDKLRAVKIPIWENCDRDDLICTSSRNVGPESVSIFIMTYHEDCIKNPH